LILLVVMANKYGSGTALLSSIVGDEGDAQFGLEEEEISRRDLHDLYDLMFETEVDSAESDHVESMRPPQPATDFFLSLGKYNDADNECSICCCEFKDATDMAKLRCGHSFCRACVARYLSLAVSEAPLIFHRRSFVRREAAICAVSVFQLELVGVPCPSLYCRGVVEAHMIRELAPAECWAQFERVGLEQQLQRLLQKKELRLCPLSCGNFIQDDCLCTNSSCRVKLLALREKERRRLELLASLNDEYLARWATDHSDIVRLCPTPGCRTQIEKNGGCENMYCVICKQAFKWPQALAFASEGHWLHRARVVRKEGIKRLEEIGVFLPLRV